jgi:polyferredoxin
MDKMNYPRGLIRYTTENALEGKYPEKAIASRLKRPRVVLYSLVLLIVFCAAVTSLALRKPFKVDIIRDRASLVRETEEGWLENSYIIKIINTTEQNQRFAITANGLPGIKVKAEQPETQVRATETQSITVQVQADPQYATKGSHEIHFVIQSLNNPALRVEEKSSFIGE